MIRVAVAGAGRMGNAIAESLGSQPDMSLVGNWGRGGDLDALVRDADVVIDFSLPAAQTVSLRIYDERGRLVRTLVDGLAPEGDNHVRWDGKDNGGRNVASGVYHYVLKSASGDLRHKMTLIR